MHGLVALDFIEELGFGLDRVVAAMAAAGLPAPVFREVGNTFVVTLYGPGARLLAPRQAERSPGSTAPTSASIRTLPERQSWALDHLRTVGPLTAREYAAALGVSAATALRDLRDLAQRGLVDASGTTNDRRYHLRATPDDR